MARRLASSMLALILVACNSEVVGQQAASTTGGTGGAGSSTSTTSAAGGSGGVAGGTPCVPEPEGNGGFAGQPTCADLSVLTVSDLVITGDGKLSPGEGAEVTAKLNEVAGKGFNWYPGVIFAADHPGVTVSAQDWFYAILACQNMNVAATITVGSDVAPGTVVNLRAQVAMLNTDCPDAYAISIPIEIE